MFVEKYLYDTTVAAGGLLKPCVAPRVIQQFKYELHTEKTILHVGISPSVFEGQDIFAVFPKEQIEMLQNKQAVLYIEFIYEPYGSQEQIAMIKELCNKWNIDCNLLIMLVANPNLTDANIKIIHEHYPEISYQNLSHLFSHGYMWNSPTFLNHEGEDFQNNINFPVECPVYDGSVKEWFVSYEEQIQYKKQHGAKDFMLLQRTFRPHRDTIYDTLNKAGLWENNNCSYLHKGIMVPLPGESERLYSIVENRDFKKIWIHTDYAKNSWVACISESHVTSPFPWLSEKWYQAVNNSLPMIMLGPQNHLDLFRDFGFKTFDKYFDECYDKQSSFEDRMNEVVTLLKNIGRIDNKLVWYESMRDVLEHNYDNAKQFNKLYPSKCVDNFVRLFNGALRSIG